MIDWTVCLHLLTAPILISWALCGGYRTWLPKPVSLEGRVWNTYVSNRRTHPVLPVVQGRHRAVVEVYRRRARPSRHSSEYFAARDTDTGEWPVIRSD